MRKIAFTVVVTIFLILNACATQNNEHSIVGNWRMESAMRNYQKTSTLDSAYFVFEKEGVFKTNLVGTEQSHPYTFSEGEILIAESDLIKKMKLVDITDSTMHLRLVIKQTPFEFQLARK